MKNNSAQATEPTTNTSTTSEPTSTVTPTTTSTTAPKMVKQSTMIVITLVSALFCALLAGLAVFLILQSNTQNLEKTFTQKIDRLEQKIIELGGTDSDIDILDNDKDNANDQDNGTKTDETNNTETNSATAKITGKLSFPSEYIPAMKVCAIDSATDVEICITTTENQQNFTITVPAGSYFVYSAMADNLNNRAYYTKCDTYEDPFIPECNSNAGNGGVDWNTTAFNCSADPVCKAAFDPFAVSVSANETKNIGTIMQGWYIPCSHDYANCD